MLKYIRPSLSILKHNKMFFATQPACHPQKASDGGTQITVLRNRIRVATEYMPTPLSCMSLYIEAGPRYEAACNNGITHFLEHLAYKGYFGMAKCQLEETLLHHGARATARTSREIQSFSCTFASECAPFIFDTLAGIINNLEMNSCQIETMKNEISKEMEDWDNDPRAVTFDYLHQTAFQGTPLAQRVIGPSSNVEKFDSIFASHYLCQHYQPFKLCFATSGNVKHDDIVLMAEKRLGHICGDPLCQSDVGSSRFTGSQIMYRNDSMPFAHVAIAFEAPGITSPDYIPLLIASNFIGKWHRSQGGGIGNASLLARAGAVDDSCESFESFYIAYRDIGLWGVYFVAKKTDLEDMVDLIQSQWMNLCITIQQTDIERAVNVLKINMSRNVCGVMNSSHDIGLQMLYTGVRKSLNDKLHELSCLGSVEMIRESAERILYDKCPAVAAVGPTEGLPEYTRIRAGQYWLRL